MLCPPSTRAGSTSGYLADPPSIRWGVEVGVGVEVEFVEVEVGVGVVGVGVGVGVVEVGVL
jgi:hypothetical protein